MPRLIWSPAALRDIARLHPFLASKNKDAARRAIRAIRQSVKILRQYPEAGRPMQEMCLEFREWPLDFGAAGYVAFYRLDDSDIIILSVRHGREADR